MVTKIANLTDIEQATTAMPLLGYAIFWRLSGIEVQHADLETALLAAGFEAHLPKPPTFRKVLRRALVAWIKNRGDDTSQNAVKRVLIRVVNDRKSEYMVFCLVGENADFAELNLSYGTNLRVLLHKKNGDIIVTTQKKGNITPTNQEADIAKEIEPFWQHYTGLLLSEDLGRMMRDIVASLNAISVRKEGGMYFIPESRTAELDTLRQLIDDLSVTGSAYVARFGVPRSDKRDMGRVFYASMRDEITAMQKDLDRFLQAEGTVRQKTIVERMSAYRTLQGKVETYCDLLGIQRENLTEEINTLRAAARGILLRDTESDDSYNEEIPETPVSVPPINPPKEEEYPF